MLVYTPTSADTAAINCFSDACGSKGMDGIHALRPMDRGVIAVRELEREQTLLKTIEVLGLSGPEAQALVFKVIAMKGSLASSSDPKLLEIFESTRLVWRSEAYREYERLCAWRSAWLKLSSQLEPGRLQIRQDRIERRSSIANQRVAVLLKAVWGSNEAGWRHD